MNDEDILKEINTIEFNNKQTYMNILMMVIHNKFAHYTFNVDKLYSIVGLEKFTQIVKTIGGRKITIPTKEDLEDAILLTNVYYLKEIKSMTWEQIQRELPEESNVMKRFYKRVYTLNEQLKKQFSELILMEEENVDTKR